MLMSEYSSVIAVSCGINISAVHHLDLSQSMRVTDRQTDGRTDRRTDRQNYDSQDALAYARAVKTKKSLFEKEPPFIDLRVTYIRTP